MGTLCTAAVKGATSLVNAGVALGLSLPFLLLWGADVRWKGATVALFFLYNLIVYAWNGDRCVGMAVTGRRPAHLPTLRQALVHKILYTLSFSTVLFWQWMPFDLLLINFLGLQLPCLARTGNTLHGWVSGVE